MSGERDVGEAARAFGRAVREAREDRGWSQRDLAARVGRTQAFISHVENGKEQAGFQSLVRLSQALEIPLAELFRDID